MPTLLQTPDRPLAPMQALTPLLLRVFGEPLRIGPQNCPACRIGSKAMPTLLPVTDPACGGPEDLPGGGGTVRRGPGCAVP